MRYYWYTAVQVVSIDFSFSILPQINVSPSNLNMSIERIACKIKYIEWFFVKFTFIKLIFNRLYINLFLIQFFSTKLVAIQLLSIQLVHHIFVIYQICVVCDLTQPISIPFCLGTRRLSGLVIALAASCWRGMRNNRSDNRWDASRPYLFRCGVASAGHLASDSACDHRSHVFPGFRGELS